MNDLVLRIGLAVLAVTPGFGQLTIATGPPMVTVSGTPFGDVNRIASVTVGSPGGAAVRFRVEAIEPYAGPVLAKGALVVTPSEGITPAQVLVGPNPNVTKTLPPGMYGVAVTFVTVDQTPPSRAPTLVRLDLTSRPPAPKIETVTNGFSQTHPISPGMLVSIRGSNLGPPVFLSVYDEFGVYPTEWGRTTVRFNGIAAPILYVSPDRIDALAPNAIAGQQTAQVVVSRYSEESPPAIAPLADASPAILTDSAGGTGQGVFIHYPDGSRNSPDNPITPGSATAITLFATGEGVWTPSIPDGTITVAARNFTTKPVSLLVGGLPARVIYAGAAPYRAGHLQVNAQLPAGLSPGQHPVVLKIGDADNAQQRVTIVAK